VHVGPAKIYHLSARQAGAASKWPAHLQRAHRLGFSHVCSAPIFQPDAAGNVFISQDLENPDPALGLSGSADAATSSLAFLTKAAGVGLLLDLVLDRVAADSVAAARLDGLFVQQRSDVVDPRVDPASRTIRSLHQSTKRLQLSSSVRCRQAACRLAAAGAAGFRLLGAQNVPVGTLARLLSRVREKTECALLIWTPGMHRRRQYELADVRPDGVFASTAWWDGRAPWFIEEHEALHQTGNVIGVVAPPIGERVGHVPNPERRGAVYRRMLDTAAATSGGLFVPMGFEFLSRLADDPLNGVEEPPLAKEIRAANDLVDRLAALGGRGEVRNVTGAAAPVTALVRFDAGDARLAQRAIGILINTDGEEAHHPPPLVDPAAGLALSGPSSPEAMAALLPGEVRIVPLSIAAPIVVSRRGRRDTLAEATKSPRVVIDRLSPSVDNGAFPARRIVGRAVTVEADVFADGHDLLQAELLWKAADETEWRRSPMALIVNDRWRGTFTPDRIGLWQFAVEAWIDEYGSLCHAIETKHRAKVDLASDLAEARAMVERLAPKAAASTRGAFERAQAALRTGDNDKIVATLSASDTHKAIAATEERAFVARHEPLPLEVERPQAEFASWYELFPRSITGDPGRHGTLLDVIGALPRVRQMGFDVLYFPPIHPIGATNRKGRNNALKAAAGDHGSPYAIGGAEGGHAALHPALGTLQDFRKLCRAAREHGLELALDFAIQCSPDHPWLKEHPGWFRWRSDGSIKFAENPPKKYEDIVNVDFYAPDAVPALWEALRDVVLFWVNEGVRIFRVDNPHTKPLPFWQWMIGEVRGRHPEVIFLSEAFTKPKMMYRLAKVGFNQSYTYFTWRNTRRELTDYLTELTTTDAAEFFRPHFFVNTPDINPFYLQTAGRAGFLVRAALATTLSGLWGMYSGFELCESAALPGREEYLDSEKYEIRVRDFGAPGNIVAEITALNRIRKGNPALHSHLGLTFYNADNDQVLVYGKALPSHEDVILVAVNLDPHHAQEATFEIPLWEWRLPDSGSLQVEDLMAGHRFVWTGKHQRVRLDPAGLPFAIWRLSTPGAAA
jgi:starch synthase (maltosyl-transferring)